MLIPTLCLTLVAAAAGPFRLAAPSLEVVNGDSMLAEFYTGHLARQLSLKGASTLAGVELAASLGLENLRSLAACADDPCRGRASAPLSIDGLLVGRVTKGDAGLLLEVRVLEPATGKLLAEASSSAETNDLLVASFAGVAEQLAAQLAGKMRRGAPLDSAVQALPGSSRARKLAWVPLVAGGAVAVVGGVFLVQANSAHVQLSGQHDPPLSPALSRALVERGTTQQLLGLAGLGIGAAALAAGAAMHLFAGDEAVHPQVLWAPGQVGVAVAGVLP